MSLGLVGCGRLASAGYLPALQHCPAIRLTDVVDIDSARADAFAAEAGAVAGRDVSIHGSVDELLAHGRADGVLLATPAAFHLDDARTLAAAGIPTLVEKPPAPDAATAAELAALSPAPWVAFNRRFDRGARTVKTAIGVDEPVDLHLSISYRRTTWGAHVVDDEALIDLGPHLVDWARWLIDGEVLAVSRADLGPERVELDLRLSRGSATLRAATDRPHAEVIEARRPDGQMIVRHQIGGLVAGIVGRLRPAPGPSSLVAGLVGELHAFASVLRGEPARDLGTAADGLAAMAVVDAARESSASGAPVAITPTSLPPDVPPDASVPPPSATSPRDSPNSSKESH
ncbi:MAG: Gfo/Idh/MocA family oxidoreductase [Actinomycetota bacterium]